MKKFLAFLSFLTLLTAFTCENEPLDDGLDSGSNNGSSAELDGTWNLVEFEIEMTNSTSFNGQDIDTDVEIFSTDVDYVVNFGQGSFVTNGSYTYDTSVSVNGGPTTSTPYTLNDVNGNGTYTTSGNEITTTGSFFEFEFSGMDLSSLTGEQTATYGITDNGQTLTFTQSETTTQSDPATGMEVSSTTHSVSVWSREDGTVIDDCELQSATNEAAAAYNEDNTSEELCVAYREALENQIAECGDEDGSLQAIIDDLGDCSAAASTGTLSVFTGTLNIEFTQQTVTFDNNIITVEGVSESGNYNIYFQVTEGETGTDVLQNFVLTLTGTEYFPSTQGFEDFTSETTVSSGNVLQATFYGTVESSAGADLSLTQGTVDLTY